MISIERSARIDASPADVWALLADFPAISSWADFVDHSCLLSEKTEGVGMVRRIQMGRTTVVETVTSWDPGVTFSYAITGLPKVIRSVTNTWLLEPTLETAAASTSAKSRSAGVASAGSSTRVSLTSVVDAGPRPPQQVIAKVVARKLAQSSDEMLAGLSSHLKVTS